jgi:hypothetical protein
VLRFANEIEDAGNEWPDTDTIGPDGWHYQLRESMAVAIEALIKAQAGKAVRPCALADLAKPPMSDLVAGAWKSRQEDDAPEEAAAT